MEKSTSNTIMATPLKANIKTGSESKAECFMQKEIVNTRAHFLLRNSQAMGNSATIKAE